MKQYRVEMYDGFDWIQAHNTFGERIRHAYSVEEAMFLLKKVKADWKNPYQVMEGTMPTVVPSAFRITERDVTEWREFVEGVDDNA